MLLSSSSDDPAVEAHQGTDDRNLEAVERNRMLRIWILVGKRPQLMRSNAGTCEKIVRPRPMAAASPAARRAGANKPGAAKRGTTPIVHSDDEVGDEPERANCHGRNPWDPEAASKATRVCLPPWWEMQAPTQQVIIPPTPSQRTTFAPIPTKGKAATAAASEQPPGGSPPAARLSQRHFSLDDYTRMGIAEDDARAILDAVARRASEDGGDAASEPPSAA